MRHLILTVTLATLVLAASACDESTTETGAGAGVPNSQSGNGSLILDQSAPVDSSQQAPVDTSQQAPVDTTQQATVDTAQQAPANGTSAGSSGSARSSCVAACQRYLALGCDSGNEVIDCDAQCAAIASEMPSGCATQLSAYLSCISTTCDESICTTQNAALENCVDPPTQLPTSTPGGPLTISNPACNTASTCASCTSTCDICICLLQVSGSSSSTISANCATSCTSA